MTSRAASLWFACFIGLSVASCAGEKAGSISPWTYPMQKIYNAGEPQVWSAVIKTLPQMGFTITFMNREVGEIRAMDDIRRDTYSFLSGTVYRLNVIIRELSPGVTLVVVNYPEIPGLLHDRVGFDPNADIFYYIQSHMGTR